MKQPVRINQTLLTLSLLLLAILHTDSCFSGCGSSKATGRTSVTDFTTPVVRQPRERQTATSAIRESSRALAASEVDIIVEDQRAENNDTRASKREEGETPCEHENSIINALYLIKITTEKDLQTLYSNPQGLSTLSEQSFNLLKQANAINDGVLSPRARLVISIGVIEKNGKITLRNRFQILEHPALSMSGSIATGS